MQKIAGARPAQDNASSVDLRSDTVTRPTAEMYEQMRLAVIGDDGLDGDPTALELERVAADALGKEAGLFVPSCTMANLIAVLAQSRRNEQVVLEASSHMFTAERGSATFSGLFYVSVPGEAGAMDIDVLRETLMFDRYRLRTALVCMETSHNNASGAVLPIDHMRAVYQLAQSQGSSVHLDGARIFNAAVALGVDAGEITQHADTVSVCMSKGLSAPVGAILAGPASTIRTARAVRKMLGGTQRQIGIMAAAALEGIRTMSGRLAEDHARARQLSLGLNKIAGLSATKPQTNIVQVDVSATGRDAQQWVADLEQAGVMARRWGYHRLRCVTHRHIGVTDVDLAVRVFEVVALGEAVSATADADLNSFA